MLIYAYIYWTIFYGYLIISTFLFGHYFEIFFWNATQKNKTPVNNFRNRRKTPDYVTHSCMCFSHDQFNSIRVSFKDLIFAVGQRPPPLSPFIAPLSHPSFVVLSYDRSWVVVSRGISRLLIAMVWRVCDRVCAVVINAFLFWRWAHSHSITAK